VYEYHAVQVVRLAEEEDTVVHAVAVAAEDWAVGDTADWAEDSVALAAPVRVAVHIEVAAVAVVGRVAVEEIDTVESLAPVAVVEGVDSLKAAVVGVSSAP